MKRFILFVLAAVFSAKALLATGMSTSFADVRVEGVTPGMPFHVRGGGSDGLYLWNPYGDALDVEVQPLSPRPDQLRDGATPIPDPSWVEIRPQHFHLSARGHQTCEVVLHVPKDKRFNNRHYQVMLWSRGTPVDPHGVTVSAGLLSRLQFKTTRR